MANVTVGVGVIIVNSHQQVLFCKRKSLHGKGSYSIPGGGLDIGERLEECAKREIYEETGIALNKLRFLGVTNNLKTYKKEGVHSVSMIFYSDSFSGKPELKEPQKHEAWEWHDIDTLPLPHFEASELAIKLYKQKLILID